MKLRTIVLSTLLLLAIVPLGVLFGSLLPGVLGAFHDASTQAALARAQARGNELAQRLERRKETVRNVALLPALVEMLKDTAAPAGPAVDGVVLSNTQAAERFSGVVQRWFHGAADVRALTVLDRGGLERLRLEYSDEAMRPVPLHPTPRHQLGQRFDQALAGAGGEPRAVLRADERVLRLYHPIRALKAGAVVGVLTMDVELRDLLGADPSDLWLDGHGHYAHQRPGDDALPDPHRLFPEFDGGERRTQVTGGPLGAYAWMPLGLGPGPRDVLWVGSPAAQDDLGRWMRALETRTLLVLAVVVLAVVLTIRRLAQLLEEVRGQMLGGLDAVLAGNPGVTFRWGGPRELRALANDLNRLVALYSTADAGRRQAENLLFRENERAEATLQAIADAVITTDLLMRADYLNPAAERLLEQEGLGKPIETLFFLVEEDSGKPLENPCLACVRHNRPFESESAALLRRSGGDEVAIQWSAAPIHERDGSITGTVLVLRDVEEERRLERLLAHQATHDSLTGLSNRRGFEAALKQALYEARRHGHTDLWLCYIDLDQFRMINDTSGHRAGDELLKLAAAEMGRAVRPEDLMARMGGDEFALLIRHVSRSVAYQVVDQMRRSLAAIRFAWRNEVFTTSGSFGLVPIHPASGTIDDLLSAADSACFVAKDHGRNRIHVADSYDDAVQRFGSEMKWAQATLRALEEDRLVLYGQPIVPLQGRGARHIEVLVRMRGEDGAIIPPGSFVPAAERYSMMRDLDRWVVQRAVRLLRACGDDDLVLAVNLSAQTLSDDDFLGFILAELDDAELPPHRLCLEITETAAIRNLSRSRVLIQQLKERGVSFALDDFGSGLSSFGYLKNLPVDYLKIDGSFVRNIAEDPLDRAFVKAIGDLGHLMGVLTVAEYVESEAVELIVREIGIDFGQGYGIARPMPLEELLAAGGRRLAG